ncbi:Hypothetical protein, putative, partial [Bodo saltans]
MPRNIHTPYSPQNEESASTLDDLHDVAVVFDNDVPVQFCDKHPAKRVTSSSSVRFRRTHDKSFLPASNVRTSRF